MDSEIDFDCSPFFRLYANGNFERLPEAPKVPPSQDPQNDVVSKDIVISPEKNLSVRIFLPSKTLEDKKKLPLLIYFHGGCFILHTAFNRIYHTFLTSAVSASNCIAVSVDYRRAPEHPIPAAYEDSWEALKWVFTHTTGSGPEPWLNEYADFHKVFLAGDSAGANISHHMAMKAESESGDIKILGIILVHPYFWSKTPIDEEDTKDVNVRKIYEMFWEIASPNSENGVDDPWFNVVGSDSSDLSRLGCEKVLVMVAGKDVLVRQGLGYAAKLKKSGWGGKLEVFESEDEIHVFHLKNPDSDNAHNFVERFAEFVKDVTS